MAFFDEAISIGDTISKFSPDRFRATITNGYGLASPSRFEVEFPSIRGMKKAGGGTVSDYSTSDDRNMTCAAAGIPGKQISTISRAIGIEQSMIATGHSFPEASFSFYLPNSYVMRDYFERWMETITSQRSGKVQYVGFYKNYVKDVMVRQYTRNGRRAYSVKLIDAYPTNIGVVELNSQLQTAAAEVTVSMTYRTYEPEQGKESLTETIKDLFG